MKRAAQEKFVTLYDTAKRCLLILDHLFADLAKGTRLASESGKVGDDVTIITGLYISALGLIDYFHRFNEIIQSMPLLKKDLPEVKKLQKLIAPVKDCRNYLQHMRNDLSKNEAIEYPVLGSISWMHDGLNYTLISQQLTVKYQAYSISYDTVLQKYVCQYQLVVGGHEIHLDTVYEGIKSFWAWLDRVSVIEPQDVKRYEWGTPMIISMSIGKP